MRHALLCLLAAPILLAIAGCATGTLVSAPASPGEGSQPTGGSTTQPAGPTLLYAVTGVFPSQTASILAFPTGTPGSVNPVNTIGQFGTDLGLIAADPHGNIYVINVATDIREYAAGSTGNTPPVRTIVAGESEIGNIEGLTVDSSGNIYVALFYDTILVYSSTATGAATPTRSIYGSQTHLHFPSVMTTDNAGNLYVANDAGGVLVFGPTADGNVAPDRIINYDVYGLATDAAGNLYTLVHNATDPSSFSAYNPASNMGIGIAIFAPGAAGTPMPIRAITMGSDTPRSIALDATGNIYVPITVPPQNGVAGDAMVRVFGASASGNAPPLYSFTTNGWTGGGDIAFH